MINSKIKHYITPSLLNAVDYYYSPTPTIWISLEKDEKYWLDKHRTELLNTLRRINTSDDNLQKARDFGISVENQIMSKIKDNNFEIDNFHLLEAVDFIKNCGVGLPIWQQAVSADYLYDDIKCSLYGKTDIIKYPVIIDIKTISNYEPRKFENSIQKAFYHYCFNHDRSSYFANEICFVVLHKKEDKETGKIVVNDCSIETYHYQDYYQSEGELRGHLQKFFRMLTTDDELASAYYDVYNLKNKIS